MECLRSSGGLFQGPRSLNKDSQWVFVGMLGTTRRPAAEDLRDLLGSHLKGMPERKAGARPFSDLKTGKSISIDPKQIDKQCDNFKIDVIWALCLVSVSARAAAFWTVVSVAVVKSGCYKSMHTYVCVVLREKQWFNLSKVSKMVKRHVWCWIHNWAQDPR